MKMKQFNYYERVEEELKELTKDYDKKKLTRDFMIGLTKEHDFFQDLESSEEELKERVVNNLDLLKEDKDKVGYFSWYQLDQIIAVKVMVDIINKKILMTQETKIIIDIEDLINDDSVKVEQLVEDYFETFLLLEDYEKQDVGLMLDRGVRYGLFKDYLLLYLINSSYFIKDYLRYDEAFDEASDMIKDALFNNSYLVSVIVDYFVRCKLADEDRPLGFFLLKNDLSYKIDDHNNITNLYSGDLVLNDEALKELNLFVESIEFIGTEDLHEKLIKLIVSEHVVKVDYIDYEKAIFIDEDIEHVLPDDINALEWLISLKSDYGLSVLYDGDVYALVNEDYYI